VRIGDVSSRPLRSQQHTNGHTTVPETHHLTEDAWLDASGTQVCRN
jgi:hypothetical protein